MATVEPKDVLPVHSRVSWGAVFAGAVTAIAIYTLLSVLGIAIGMTVGSRVEDTSNIGTGAAIWAVITLMLSLFLGGWVTSQCTTNETKMEAVVYGVIVWGAMFALLAWPLMSRLRLGFSDLITIAGESRAAAAAGVFSDQDLRTAGFTDEQINNQRTQFDKLRNRGQDLGAQIRDAATDPRAVNGAWWTFGGILLSMLAAISGAVAGAGPELRLVRTGSRSVFMATSTTRNAARSEQAANR